MGIFERIVLAAAAGALIYYGITHRHTRKKVNEVFDKIENNPEGWFALIIGVLLLLGALLSF